MRTIAISLVNGILMLCLLSCVQAKDEGVQAKDEAPLEEFSFEHATYTAGVVPKVTDFIKIKTVKEEGGRVYTLTAGQEIHYYGENPDEITIKVKKQLKKAQCVALCDDARKLGFFKLKDRYIADYEGGSGTRTLMTINDLTKKVNVYGTKVPEIAKLVKKVRALYCEKESPR